MLTLYYLQVLSVVGIICAGAYPTVIVPLRIAYGGAERPVSCWRLHVATLGRLAAR